ncbi:MAG: DUF1549 and DUF1553 domain-containing protein [Isosphaeraceae bacterium]
MSPALGILAACFLTAPLGDDDHWAFVPPGPVEPPAVKRADWARNPIDRFLLEGLETLEVAPSPEASRVALIRRVTFDLIGLPPTPEQVADFVADDRPDAHERLVDRLLASPQYGERWAQHWLDLAHYADSNGFELDAERPDAWRYRDWVVRSFNEDLPYDRFLALQLAGDEVAPGDADALIATGFGRCGPREVVGGNIDPRVRRQSELTEVTGTVGSVFLGLTMACARCHDHKFDPIPTADYYGLQAFFAGAQFLDRPIAKAEEEEAYQAAKKAIDERTAPFKKQLAELEAPYRKALRASKEALLSDAEREALKVKASDRTAEQKKIVEGANIHLTIHWEEVAEAVSKLPADHERREALKRSIFEIERTMPPPPAKAMALIEEGSEAPETFIYRRGEVRNVGPKVDPRPPGALVGEAGFDPSSIATGEKTSGRRAALVRWLGRPDHPLTARVIVNRLWQHHFGRGIVATPSDFGTRGEPPSHPELLDWLANELVRSGWELKPIHRLMVTSAAYRQASDTKHGVEADPENTTLWRMNRRRMDAESLRDAMLAVSGELNPKSGGPGVLVPIEKEIEDLIFTEAEVVDLWPETQDPAEHLRRSLYLFRKRNVRYPMFDAFDAPDTQSACAIRSVSTHAPQALVMLNSDFAIDRARSLADRARREGGDEAGAIARLYRRVLARDPSPSEVGQARAFLAGSLGDEGWVDLALAMLNRNEFVYVP